MVEGDNVTWWDSPMGGQLLSTTNRLELTVLRDTTFYVEEFYILANNALCSSIRVPLDVNLTTSTAEIEAELGLRIYPNPAQEELNITTTEDISNGTARLLDTQGKLWKKQLLSGRNNSMLLEDVVSGIYMLQLEVDGKLISQKVIVQQEK